MTDRKRGDFSPSKQRSKGVMKGSAHRRHFVRYVRGTIKRIAKTSNSS